MSNQSDPLDKRNLIEADASTISKYAGLSTPASLYNKLVRYVRALEDIIPKEVNQSTIFTTSQTVDREEEVTINSMEGIITTTSESLAAGSVGRISVANSEAKEGDILSLTISVGGSYDVQEVNVYVYGYPAWDGGFDIMYKNDSLVALTLPVIVYFKLIRP
jgi:hypothetical protein